MRMSIQSPNSSHRPFPLVFMHLFSTRLYTNPPDPQNVYKVDNLVVINFPMPVLVWESKQLTEFLQYQRAGYTKRWTKDLEPLLRWLKSTPHNRPTKRTVSKMCRNLNKLIRKLETQINRQEYGFVVIWLIRTCIRNPGCDTALGKE